MTTEGGGAGYRETIALRLLPGLDTEKIDEQYEAIRFALQRYEDEVDPPLSVRLCRRAPELLGDEDLAEAMEVCRDAMVDVLGVPSDDPGVAWTVEQERAEGEELLVEVVPAE